MNFFHVTARQVKHIHHAIFNFLIAVAIALASRDNANRAIDGTPLCGFNIQINKQIPRE